MTKSFLTVLFFGFCIVGNAQTQKDSIIIQTGLLFLSEYNFIYDTTRSGDLIQIPTFSDFFFPEQTSIVGLLRNKKILTYFQKGIRLYYFKNRLYLLKMAKKIKCIPDSSLCYPFQTFRILPVKIQYVQTIYNDIPACSDYYFDIRLKNRKIFHFPLIGKVAHIKQVDVIHAVQKTP